MAASQSFREDIIKAVARIDGFEQQLANAVKAPERRIECISGAARASKPELLTTVPPASSLITGNSPWTDLMRAAANGNIEAVKRHLADKDKKNSDGGTALMVAARRGVWKSWSSLTQRMKMESLPSCGLRRRVL
ncbi:Hypothetical protein GSB_155391 [Giardia duodenalis]|uniref:Ankyrin repeat protein n=1 Tax=Giardia intestinalis TaxID=5741 RepID=V6TNT4_GIAIN|nr:Hypothetical protein GSB_155391 [Giardia intestinalis]